MRPFDIEPNYLEELMLSKNPENFRSTSTLGKNFSQNSVTTRNEFLKYTMRDRNFIKSYGKIVSASPYRAVIRRMDYEPNISRNQEEDEEERNKEDDKDDDDFERDHNNDLRMTYSQRNTMKPYE